MTPGALRSPTILFPQESLASWLQTRSSDCISGFPPLTCVVGSLETNQPGVVSAAPSLLRYQSSHIAPSSLQSAQYSIRKRMRRRELPSRYQDASVLTVVIPKN